MSRARSVPNALSEQFAKSLTLFVNLRPIRGRKALAPVMPVKDEIIGEGLDFIVIRELAGGLYYGEPRGIEPHADGRTRLQYACLHDAGD